MPAPIDAPGNPTRWSAMRLTKATLDQVQILVLVARSQADIISVSDVAVQLTLTKPNALKLVTRLVRTGVLRAKRGPGGGVKLGRPASQILLGHIVSQLESINAKITRKKIENRGRKTGWRTIWTWPSPRLSSCSTNIRWPILPLAIQSCPQWASAPANCIVALSCRRNGAPRTTMPNGFSTGIAGR
jgi:Rrf2 family protein